MPFQFPEMILEESATGNPADRIIINYGKLNPPTSIEKIIQSFGIQILEATNPGWDYAYRTTKDNQALIWISTSVKPEARSFFLAISFGFIIANSSKESIEQAFWGTHPIPDEIRKFAKDLLMPLWTLGEIGLSHSLERLSTWYNVPLGLMEERIREMVLLPPKLYTYHP